ncbi:MAG: phosphoglycolate phosphatase [Rhizobiales bacterium]|nr:phosphoglycolate phosphatase [Hyphomicrobiales bacterium]
MTSSLLLFDLDGTLLETAPDLVGTLNTILVDEGLEPIELATARNFIGQGARAMIELGHSTQSRKVTPERLDELFPVFLERYEARIAQETYAFPGLFDSMETLRSQGWALGVCTNKVEHLARKLLGQLDMLDWFTVITGGDTFDQHKPHPAHILETIKLANADPARSIMVGDSANDIDAAKAANVPVIAVDFGYTMTPVTELGPDIVISHFSELEDAVGKLKN